MKNYYIREEAIHNPDDPSPWLALDLDQTTPIRPTVKAKWLNDCSSKSRQFILPFARPFARFLIVLIQVLKALSPYNIRASKTLHRLIVFGLRHFVRPEANELILRHFNIGSEILHFIAANIKGVEVKLSPLTPKSLNDLLDNTFLKHDLNLYNFIINLNTDMHEKGLKIEPVDNPDYSMITDDDFVFEKMPNRFTNFVDLATAIEMYTPVYQLLLTDNDFWRSVHSLQLDETIALYVATILNSPEHLVLLNNKHPLVPMSTLRAGYRLVLHGLSSEMLHYLLVKKKREQMQHAG